MRPYPSMLVSLLVTAVSLGCTADFTAVDSPWPVVTLSVEPASAVVPVGTSIQLSATPRDSTGAIFTELPTTWTTSNGSMATVGDGIVHGMAAGSVEIIATVEGKSDTAVITVTSSPTPPPPPAPPPATRPICSISPTDGQDAIAAAIAGCPSGSTVMFPAGASYTQTDQIRIIGRNDLIIDGNGSTFTKTSPSADGAIKHQWSIESGNDIVIRNMTVTGAFIPANHNGGVRHLIPGLQFEHGFMIFAGTRITIQDVTCKNPFGDCVAVTHERAGSPLVIPNTVVIERVVGEHIAREGVSIAAGIGVWVQDCEFTDVWSNAGIDIEMDYVGEQVRNVHLLRNTFSDFYFQAMLIAVKNGGGGPGPGGPADVRDIEFRGNITLTSSDGCQPAIQIPSPDLNVGNPALVEGIVIEDNTLRSRGDAVWLQDVNSGTVKNNTLIAVSTDVCGPPPRTSVRLYNSPNVVVSGNTVVGY
jgi:hypothetical protein